MSSTENALFTTAPVQKAVLTLEPVLFPLLGAQAETWAYLKSYIFWTIGVGAVPTVMKAEFAHLIRSEGYSRPAGFGVALGGILNIALDPLFIFGLRLNIIGAAVSGAQKIFSLHKTTPRLLNSVVYL